MKSYKNIFVTVGTTKFDDLIKSLSEAVVVDQLKLLGCKQLTIQIGSGDDVSSEHFENSSIEMETFKTKPNIIDYIEKSDLVISHAGAGTCLEVLNHKKPLIVVVNESLMDNHQTELALRLSEKECALYCTPNELGSALDSRKLDNLKPYERSNGIKNFVKHLDLLMGVQ